MRPDHAHNERSVRRSHARCGRRDPPQMPKSGVPSRVTGSCLSLLHRSTRPVEEANAAGKPGSQIRREIEWCWRAPAGWLSSSWRRVLMPPGTRRHTQTYGPLRRVPNYGALRSDQFGFPCESLGWRSKDPMSQQPPPDELPCGEPIGQPPQTPNPCSEPRPDETPARTAEPGPSQSPAECPPDFRP